MYSMQDVMQRHLVTLREGDTLESADQLIKLGHLRHLPVVREGKLVGLVTHRDLLRHAARKRADSGPVRVREMMTERVASVRPETSLRYAIDLMLANKFGCLPVTASDGTLLGIVTDSDLLRVAADRCEELDRRALAAEYDADA
jgi:CBS domain-containing protein